MKIANVTLADLFPLRVWVPVLGNDHARLLVKLSIRWHQLFTQTLVQCHLVPLAGRLGLESRKESEHAHRGFEAFCFHGTTYQSNASRGPRVASLPRAAKVKGRRRAPIGCPGRRAQRIARACSTSLRAASRSKANPLLSAIIYRYIGA